MQENVLPTYADVIKQIEQISDNIDNASLPYVSHAMLVIQRWEGSLFLSPISIIVSQNCTNL